MGFLGNETGISFSKLGIVFDNVPKGIKIFGISISISGILLVLSIIAGVILVIRKAAKTNERKEDCLEITCYVIIVSAIGSRLEYFITHLDVFSSNILDIFNINYGHFSFCGALISSIIVIIIYALIKKVNPFKVSDSFIPSIIICQIAGCLGDFFNRSGLGRHTTNLFSMNIDIYDNSLSSIYKKALVSDYSIYANYGIDSARYDYIAEIRNNLIMTDEGSICISVHPVFLYEIVLCIALLVFILIYYNNKKFNGEITLIYLIGYFFSQAILDFFRAENLWLIRNINVGQIMSSFLAIAFILLLIFKYKQISKRTVKI